ncbi:MAG: single-stranded DNA-binding protein [Bacteroidetes bacterium]|nr:single-stranded DNA-binding protein [Bacteroidota bacterium]
MRNLKNRVNLIGNLGMDPEIKKLENGSSLAKFSLATSDSYKNKDGEKVKETQWHNLVAWGNTAQFAEKYLKKGQEIAVEGKLTHRTYENSEGDKQYITEVVVNEIQMLRSTNNA